MGKFIKKENIAAQILTGIFTAILVLSLLYGIVVTFTPDSGFIPLISFGVALVSFILLVVIKLLTKIAEKK